MEIRCRSPPDRVSPSLADDRLVTIRHLTDKVIALGQFGGTQYCRIGSVPFYRSGYCP